MRQPELRRPLAVLVALSLLAACASPKAVAPIEDLGTGYEPFRDERTLWEESRAEERKLDKNARLYGDPLLGDYLNELATNLASPGMAEQEVIRPRIKVLEDPALNAFAYPTGSIYVHTGLLARLENEDQLAGVLAHEMTHVDERHLLKHQRSAKRKAIGFAIASVAASVIIAHEAGEKAESGDYSGAYTVQAVSNILLGLGLQLAFIAAINGYGRDLERAADAGAIRSMRRAGYDPGELERVFDLLLDDHGDSTKMETFFFGSHPRLQERKEDTRAILAAAPAQAEPTSGEVERDPGRFDRRMRSVLKDDARMNIAEGRFRLASAELERALAIVSEDADALHLKGELHLAWAGSTKNPERVAERRRAARDAFLAALEVDPDYAPAYRELGLLAFRDGDKELACESFETYVSLAPDAEDAARIEDYVREIRSEGRCPQPEPEG